MSNTNTKKKNHKLWINTVRAVGISVSMIWMIFLIYLSFKSELSSETEDVLILSILPFFAFFFLIDLRNQRQWIKDTAEIVVLLNEPLQSELRTEYRKNRKELWLSFVAFVLPLIAGTSVLFLVSAPDQFLVAIGVVAVFVPIYLVYWRVRSRKKAVFYLSEIGMIYAHDCVPWGDKWFGTFLEDIQCQPSATGGCSLMIKRVKMYKFGNSIKTYRIDLPNYELSVVSDFVDRITVINNMNRMKRDFDKGRQ